MSIGHKTAGKRGRRPKNKNVLCRSYRDGKTNRLYAMAVDRFFSGIDDKDERFKVLTDKEEKALIEKYRDDPMEMMKQLVMHNIFLAIGYASGQQHRFVDHDELIALSMFGLMEAAKKFDPSKGWRFSTYAVWYLKKNVLKRFYVKKEHVISDNTAIFIDDPATANGDDNEDFVFATINDQLEPTLNDNYKSHNAVDDIYRSEHDIHMKDMLEKVVETVATSSLSDIDKQIFNMSFIEQKSNRDISKELGIPYSAVSNGRKHVLTFINDNFSKEEVFAA